MSFQDGSERMVGHSVFIAVAAVAGPSETIMRRPAKSPLRRKIYLTLVLVYSDVVVCKL